MADQTITVKEAEGSPAAVAYKLTEKIMYMDDVTRWDRKTVLDLYAECLQATSGYRRLEK